jgi:DNA polymerase-4
MAVAPRLSALCRDCFWRGTGPSARCEVCGSPRILAHAELFDLAVAHLDCDAFYASVEKRDRPQLRDAPVIVGGGKRGVVTAACYIARSFGVRAAMPMFKARRLCPGAIVVAPDFAKYRAVSSEVMQRIRALTPLVQPLSLDEAWMDLSGTERLHGAPPAMILARLQNEIEKEIGVGVSIGLAPNKLLAKIASDLDKPRGFAVIGLSDAQAILAPLPVTVLPGIGPAAAAALRAEGLRTVGDIANLTASAVLERCAADLRLTQFARGLDDRRVDPAQGRKSVSAETTFEDDLASLTDLEDRLWPLCEKVARRTRGEALAGRVVTLKLRAADFRVVTRRRTLPQVTQTAKRLFAVGQELLAAEPRGARWRLVGIGLSDFEAAAEAQSELFADPDLRVLQGERAVDTLRGRFGARAVVRARALRT